jgi:hypothetical protein
MHLEPEEISVGRTGKFQQNDTTSRALRDLLNLSIALEDYKILECDWQLF